MTTTGAPAVALNEVRKAYKAVQAVDGVTLTVEPGEIVAFLGPNGAGKTTTIDMMLGLARPDSGSVEVFGETPQDAVAQGRISAVMQTGGLLKDLTVAETVRLTGSLFSHTRPVDEVLERAGLTDKATRKVGKCSGGEQQRLRFAMALLSDPDLLVLDEPTTGMDVGGRRDFWGAIRDDASRGRTVLFATHYLEEADAYADRIVLVAHGKVVADGTAAEVRNLAAGRIVAATLPGATVGRAARPCPASTTSRCAATGCCCTPATPTSSPATCSPRRPPATWRSPAATSRTRSSRSPATTPPPPRTCRKFPDDHHQF